MPAPVPRVNLFRKLREWDYVIFLRLSFCRSSCSSSHGRASLVSRIRWMDGWKRAVLRRSSIFECVPPVFRFLFYVLFMGVVELPSFNFLCPTTRRYDEQGVGDTLVKKEGKKSLRVRNAKLHTIATCLATIVKSLETRQVNKRLVV